jgi:short-subunit dehydrogenase
MELRGAVCLITGASSGIGRATAVRLAAAGAGVVAAGRDGAALQSLVDRTGAVALHADLNQDGAAAQLAADAVKALGHIDVLVNNAGEGWAGPLAQMDPEEADRLVRVNLQAPIALTRALLPQMLERGRGHIVNVASIAGHVGVRDESVYASTKSGLIAFSESLRYELVGTGVGVSVVSPAAVRTAFFDRRGRPYERKFPRQVPPEDVADAIANAIEHDRPDVFVPRWMALPARMRGATPGVFRFFARRFG